MKTAVCGAYAPAEIIDSLGKYSDNIIVLPPFSALPSPVSSHADMLIFPAVKSGVIYTHAEYLAAEKAIFERLTDATGMRIAAIPEKVGRDYPRDVLLNALALGNKIVGKIDALSSAVLPEGNHINTKQGYAKCSSCKVTENAVITEDGSIAKALLEVGADVLVIEKGHVSIRGFDCGFIGGASGCDSENVYFCGNIEAHPDYDKIFKFCRKHGKNVVSLSQIPLTDVGTVFFI